MIPAKLNIGSGNDFQQPGYYNLDLRRTSKGLSVQSDARALPIKSEAIQEIISFHLVEHVGMVELVPMLKDWCRVLKRGAAIKIECPDFDGSVKQYLEADEKSRGRCLKIIFGFQPVDYHYNGLNQKRLKDAMTQAGFVNVKPGVPTRRIFGPQEPLLRMEGRKP